MGEGEYGGNGSVHWKVSHAHGQGVTCNGASAHGVDNQAQANDRGEFRVTVEDVAPDAFNYNPASRTLTVSVPIKHGPNYTRQVRIRWP